jgi:carbonic anhydrase
VLTSPPATPGQALAELHAGNHRFVTGTRVHPNQDAEHRAAMAEAQRPFAAIFGCSDSRLAAEIIFDRGLGDLFVVRTAGHVLGPEVLGSIEYAVATFDLPLIAVLGHDGCGAIAAALESLAGGPTPVGSIRDVVERVTLGMLPVLDEALLDPEVAVEEHIRYTTELLAGRSPLIAERLAQGRLGVVGLAYRLVEGSVRRIAALGV